MPSCLSTPTKPNRRQSHPHRKDATKYKCVLCGKFHPLRLCKRFGKMSLSRKEAVIHRHKFCINCLAQSHDLRGCTSMDTCRKCDMFHHTLLHPPDNNEPKRRRLPHRKSSTKATSSAPKAKSFNHQPSSNKKKQQARNKKSAKPTAASSSTVITESSTTNTPNARIILEAIKSLAQVLCTDVTPTTIA